MTAFVGRAEPLARLTAALQAAAAGSDGVGSGRAGLVLVTGEAGIGKTALLTRFAADAVRHGATVVWGTCWDADLAPAWWPWTQALRALLDQWGRRDLAGAELAAIVPELAAGVSPAGSDASGRLRVLDAARQLLGEAAAEAPLAVILDDLQWADQSTVDLMRFVVPQQQRGALLLVGAYRPQEVSPDIAAALADLAVRAELLALQGLSAGEVAELLQVVAGPAAPHRWAPLVHERSGGHPFYARELCHLLATTGTAHDVPTAVREVINGRLARLSTACAALLDAAAVAGSQLQPDVLADVTDDDPTRVIALAAEAFAAGILARAGDQLGAVRFAHDLYREAIYVSLPPGRRLDLHHRTAAALQRRHERGSPVFAAELARHFTAALPAAGIAPALLWAHAAARIDAGQYAFAEAAGHLTRLRSAIDAANGKPSEADLVHLLTTEADLRLRAGDASRAHALLDTAWARATATGTAELVGAVALGLDRLDARFAMPRADLIGVLETAREAVRSSGTPAEARVTAALARQLQHSVPADRPGARSLAEHAVRIARTVPDPTTLASCLLALHDTLWTPGTAAERARITAEIADLAKRANDAERHAQALLLTATGQLESGSAAFRATFAEYAYLTVRLRQPRHDYLLRTRQAALALIDGDIETGERLSADAAALGEKVGDSDTGNVRMSQRLEVVRARNDATELREMAAEAVRWWIGAPAHAHAVAAGFSARAGDLDTARRELDTVLALDWRTDRSYLWSVLVGEMTTAAIALEDRPLCEHLLDDLRPIADTCAVNGALVCFMGAHAHRVGLLYAALGRPAPARQWLRHALDIHRRLNARAWLAETLDALAGTGGPGAAEHARHARVVRAELGLAPPVVIDRTDDPPRLRRVGDMWEASFRGDTVYLRDVKGLHDLAALLANPGVDLPAVQLAGAEVSDGPRTARSDPVLDRAALVAYRRRLTELDEELAAARADADLAGQRRASDEREQLLGELGRATRPDGASRAIGTSTAERARKAVTARVRDAIRRITDALPALGSHLDRTIRTGTVCRYEPRS
ncbi:MAG TPA: AAA family ATPase [Asanoa sp.]